MHGRKDRGGATNAIRHATKGIGRSTTLHHRSEGGGDRFPKIGRVYPFLFPRPYPSEMRSDIFSPLTRRR